MHSSCTGAGITARICDNEFPGIPGYISDVQGCNGTVVVTAVVYTGSHRRRKPGKGCVPAFSHGRRSIHKTGHCTEGKLLCACSIAVEELKVGAVDDPAFVYIDAFIQVDRRSECLGESVVHPVLRIGVVAIVKLDVRSVVGIAVRQVDAFGRVFCQFDLQAVEVPLLVGGAERSVAIPQLNVCAVAGIPVVQVQTFV